MRLINYGPGEITDRLTILSLKILIGKEKGRDIDHFRSEQVSLLQQIRSRSLNGVWFEQVLELAAVNGQLWQAEDELRHYRDVQHHDSIVGDPMNYYAGITRLAFRIQALNDRRAALITLINTNAGEAVVQEKI
jgi:hypothetical protein